MSSYFRIFFLCAVGALHGQAYHFIDFYEEDVRITYENDLTTVALPFEIKAGYHIQLEEVEDDNLIPTKIRFEDVSGYEIVESSLDCLHLESITLGKKAIQVISHSFEVKVVLRPKGEVQKSVLRGSLYYQTCDDFKCYFPRELSINIPLN
jgi:hypothetical protein